MLGINVVDNEDLVKLTEETRVVILATEDGDIAVVAVLVASGASVSVVLYDTLVKGSIIVLFASVVLFIVTFGEVGAVMLCTSGVALLEVESKTTLVALGKLPNANVINEG